MLMKKTFNIEIQEPEFSLWFGVKLIVSLASSTCIKTLDDFKVQEEFA